MTRSVSPPLIVLSGEVSSGRGISFTNFMGGGKFVLRLRSAFLSTRLTVSLSNPGRNAVVVDSDVKSWKLMWISTRRTVKMNPKRAVKRKANRLRVVSMFETVFHKTVWVYSEIAERLSNFFGPS